MCTPADDDIGSFVSKKLQPGDMFAASSKYQRTPPKTAKKRAGMAASGMQNAGQVVQAQGERVATSIERLLRGGPVPSPVTRTYSGALVVKSGDEGVAIEYSRSDAEKAVLYITPNERHIRFIVPADNEGEVAERRRVFADSLRDDIEAAGLSRKIVLEPHV